jgi:hypothetical protein
MKEDWRDFLERAFHFCPKSSKTLIMNVPSKWRGMSFKPGIYHISGDVLAYCDCCSEYHTRSQHQ